MIREFDYRYECYDCGTKIEATKRSFESIEAFVNFVDKVHGRECKRGKREHADNPTAGKRAEEE